MNTTQQIKNNPELFASYEVFIIRNAKLPRLFDVVMIDFFKEDAVQLESNLSFEQAQEQQEYWESLLLGMPSEQFELAAGIYEEIHY